MLYTNVPLLHPNKPFWEGFYWKKYERGEDCRRIVHAQVLKTFKISKILKILKRKFHRKFPQNQALVAQACKIRIWAAWGMLVMHLINFLSTMLHTNVPLLHPNKPFWEGFYWKKYERGEDCRRIVHAQVLKTFKISKILKILKRKFHRKFPQNQALVAQACKIRIWAAWGMLVIHLTNFLSTMLHTNIRRQATSNPRPHQSRQPSIAVSHSASLT